MNEGIFYRIAVKRQAKITILSNAFKFLGSGFLLLLILFSLILVQFPIAEWINSSIGKSTGNPMQPLLFGILTFGVLMIMILPPFALGFIELCIRIAGKKEASIGDVFLWLGDGRRYLKSVAIGLQFALIYHLFFLPANILSACVFLGYIGDNYLIEVLITGLAVVAAANIGVFLPGFFLLAEDTSKKPFKCLKESLNIFKKRKWDIFIFFFSFFGWAFLIGMIWSSATVMSISNSGIALVIIDEMVQLTSIPTGVLLRATIYSMVSSGALLLYVVPYILTATAYYIKGVINPDLFKVEMPPRPQAARKQQKLGPDNKDASETGKSGQKEAGNPKEEKQDSEDK